MAERIGNHRPISASAGEQTNPTSGTVMADTGAVPFGGIYEIMIMASASAFAVFNIQRRDAANATTLGNPIVFYGQTGAPTYFVWRLEAQTGERFRVVMNANLTGTAAVGIEAQKMG